MSGNTNPLANDFSPLRKPSQNEDRNINVKVLKDGIRYGMRDRTDYILVGIMNGILDLIDIIPTVEIKDTERFLQGAVWAIGEMKQQWNDCVAALRSLGFKEEDVSKIDSYDLGILKSEIAEVLEKQ